MARGHPDYFDKGGKNADGDEVVDWQFLIDNGLRILGDRLVTSSTSTIYTVPTGKVFYLISTSMSIKNTTANSVTGFVLIGQVSILTISCEATNGKTANLSNSYSTPIKLVAGEQMKGQVFGGGNTGQVTFQGYEVDA